MGNTIDTNTRTGITVNMIDSRATYRAIINAPDAAARERLFTEQIVGPWLPMMQMLSGMFNVDLDADPLGVARAWAWVMPDQLTSAPDALTRLEAVNAWVIAEDALKRAAALFAPYADRVPFDTVEGWLLVADPDRADPITRGYTGAVDWVEPRLVVQFDTPDATNLPLIPGLMAHEFHHLVRLRLFPWSMNITVGEYIIHEGMAESLATALFGDAVLPHTVTHVGGDTDRFETATRVIGAALDATGFDVVRSYIFGDYWAEKLNLPTFGVPAYGGYGIGYYVVQAYLKRTGASITEATFRPADEIIAESGFFGRG